VCSPQTISESEGGASALENGAGGTSNLTLDDPKCIDLVLPPYIP
jgi:hypothetical protein